MNTVETFSGPSQRYARITALLREQPEIHGAEGLFNMALTNALVAIAQHVSLPDATNKNGRPHSASRLLTLLQSRGALENSSVEVLHAAIEETDAARHGRRATRRLLISEVGELVKLDEHPALGCLEDVIRDDEWVRNEAADLMEHARAEAYLVWIEELFGDAEITRRLKLRDEAPTPEDSPDYGAAQECPVCSNEALLPSTYSSDYGYSISPGTCLVCSYTRSAQAAHHEEWLLEMRRLMDKD